MRTNLVPLALLLCAALPSAAVAGRPEVIDTTASDVTLSYRFARGDAMTYTASVTADAEYFQGTDGLLYAYTAGFALTYEVQSVSDTGTALIATLIRSVDVNMTVDGEPLDAPDVEAEIRSRRRTRSVAADGTLLDRTGEEEEVELTQQEEFAVGVDRQCEDALLMMWPQLPTEAIGPGDSWLQVVPLSGHRPGKGFSDTATVRYTLAGFADEGGRRVAVIDAEIVLTVDGDVTSDTGHSLRVVGRGNGTGYILFDVQGGRVLEFGSSEGAVVTGTLSSGPRISVGGRTDTLFRAQVVNAQAAPE